MVLPHMSRLRDYSIRGQYTLAGLKCWVHVATSVCMVETLVPGGPYISKYVEIGGTNFGGGPYIIST